MKKFLLISLLLFYPINAHASTCSLNEFRFSKYDDLIYYSAAEFKIEPSLVFGVIEAESNFNPYAKSSMGAKGLMQLMGPTARKMGVQDPYHPAQNIHGGTRYLRLLYDKYDGNIDLTLAAYNVGPAKVSKRRGVPQAARPFVKKVKRLKVKYVKPNKVQK